MLCSSFLPRGTTNYISFKYTLSCIYIYIDIIWLFSFMQAAYMYHMPNLVPYDIFMEVSSKTFFTMYTMHDQNYDAILYVAISSTSLPYPEDGYHGS